jgi:rhodanese-related sulfurtransferase
MDIKQAFAGLLDKIKKTKGRKTAPVQADKSVLLDKIRQSDLFEYLEPEYMEKLFAAMDTIALPEGATVIKEGDEGDYYYLLVTGTAQVTRKSKTSAQPEILAELTEPTGFGEDALISNAKRNATVTMTTGGTLMRLSKDAFNDYIKAPVITWLSTIDARQKIAEGAKWLDVRDDEETKDGGLPNAVRIPLASIRNRISELDKNSYYVCYCQNGRLSSTAAFLLVQCGYKVGVMRGGLKAIHNL